ncbi:hypothetical protein GCM10023310_61830 [Paenibacillus vulneris]|uniref:Flagellar protein FlaG n=1 Tax=Paenibacillus vulneris TaxID=1133364 RepID=A0ABW3UDE6_9BACL|nr:MULTISPECIES: flagellar protein FlaG [unclassified Paenibacillus]MBE1447426.1 flagellar protein FlaG [Paenibacillus sp. OAS669]
MISDVSLNGSSSIPLTGKETAVKAAEPISSAPITNSKDLHKAEIQGARVSTGDEQIVKAIERALKALQGPTTMVEVSVHEETKQVMVKVLDQDSGKVIREIPPEKMLDLVANMMKVAGLLIDERR